MEEQDKKLTDKIEKIVAKIDGQEKGNAFLIDNRRALTVKHCVKEERLKLIFPKQQYREVWASACISEFAEEDRFVLLELEEEVDSAEIILAATRLYPGDPAWVYGFDKNFFAEGRWTKLESVGSVTPNDSSVTDQLFDALNNKEADFSGLSGSPIIAGGNIVGIVAQQNTESQRAIAIRAISVISSQTFLKENEIPVINDLHGEYPHQNELVAGEYIQTRIPVTVAGIQDFQTRLEGIYKEKLESIIQLHRKGNIEAAWEQLRQVIVELGNDPYIRNEIKAEFYYRMAIWYLEDRNNIQKAQKKFDMAEKLNPGMDGSVFRAIKQSMTGENVNAEEILEPIDSVNKFNVYLQICINTGKTDKALDKYYELDDIVPMNDGSYYLLSVIMILQQHYAEALDYIDKALLKETDNPFYRFTKGVIYYWMALPEELRQSADLYPPMFQNGIVHLTEKEFLDKAQEEYRQAEKLAEQVKNDELAETILNAWVCSLSVDGSYENDILEPLHILQNRSPLNLTAILYRIQRKLPLPAEVTIEKLEKTAKNASNKIACVIAAVELSIYQKNQKKAKSLLHEYKDLFLKGPAYEYWYEYIVKVEDKKENLQKYEQEIDENTALEEVRKKRLKCLFLQSDPNREQELEENLVSNYQLTKSRMDLLNLITFYKAKRNWGKMSEYADKLVDVHKDSYGMLYQIQALLELQENQKALEIADELEDKKIWGTELEVSWDKMYIYQQMGEYDKAIAAGERVLACKATEDIILKLSNLCALNGEEGKALQILLSSELRGVLTVPICQRISVYYLNNDNIQAWKYAEKAIELSNRQPGILLWAIDIANRTGNSDFTGQYLQEVMSGEEANLVQAKSVEEVLELLMERKKEAEEHVQSLYGGELISHLFVDASKRNYGEYFLGQWNSGPFVPLEFGAHYYGQEQMKELKQGEIVLDYSSCLFLYAVGALKDLLESMDRVYVAGILFGVLSEEIRKIPVAQEDLVNANYRTVQKCKELKVEFVVSQNPENPEELSLLDRTQVSRQKTALQYGAMWISEEGGADGIWDMELISALYRRREISQETYDEYVKRNCTTGSREEVVRELEKKLDLEAPEKLYVDMDILVKWDKHNLLKLIGRKFRLLSAEESSHYIREQYHEIQEKKTICRQLEELREILLQYKDKGKIAFFQMTEQNEDMTYTDMLASELRMVESKKLPLCVDDRILTSYSSVGESNIYNTFDLLKYLRWTHRISTEKYFEIYEKIIEHNIQYVLPDREYIYWTLENARTDDDGALNVLEKYIFDALSPKSFIQKDRVEHVNMPEKDYYIFYMHRDFPELIQKIWRSNMNLQKKYSASEWILKHFSPFAYQYGDYTGEAGKKESLSILLADLLMKGVYIMGPEETKISAYYEWLDSWLQPYLMENPDIQKKTVTYLQKMMNAFMKNLKYMERKEDQRVSRYIFAMGIHCMPEIYREALLTDEEIQKLYDAIYCEYYITLSEQRRIPQKIMKRWEQQALSQPENVTVVDEYDGIEYHISRDHLLPGYPRLNICWKEGDAEQMLLFLLDREEGAEKDLSETFQQLKMNKILEEDWLFREEMQKYILPLYPDYFRQYYDCSTAVCNVEKVGSVLPIQLNDNNRVGEDFEDNHNPVRLLHKLEMQFTVHAEEQEILATIEALFSYAGGDNARYGAVYLLLLRYIWKMLQDTDRYRDITEDNLIMWSYLWADQMMSVIRNMILSDRINIDHLIRDLERIMGNIQTWGLWTKIIPGPATAPETVNLYRICVNGTLQTICRYKASQSVAAAAIDMLLRKYSEWMTLPIHYMEANFTIETEENTQNSLLQRNFHALVEKTADLGKCKEKLSQNKQNVWLQDNEQLCLNAILQKDEIDINELIYLLLLTRKPLTEVEQDMVQRIVEKNVEQGMLELDENQANVLNCIVDELPPLFREKYRRLALESLGEFLCTKQITLEKAYDLAWILADGWENFVSFWEKNTEKLTDDEKKQMCEEMGRLQYMMPFEYAERIREVHTAIRI